MLLHSSQRIFSLWVPVLAWAGLIFALSTVAGLQSGFPTGIDLVLRKIAHAAEFGIFSALLLRAMSQEGVQLTRRTFALSFFIAVAYAISDEWHQAFVEDRVGSVRDIAIDGAGAIVGVDLLRRWYQRKSKQPR